MTQRQVPQPTPTRTVSSSNTSDPTGVPVHPDVRLTPLPFFEVLDVLERPTSLGKPLIYYWLDSNKGNFLSVSLIDGFDISADNILFNSS